MNEAERFWSKVDVGHPLGCWTWGASTQGTGYGKFVAGSRSDGTRRFVLAHRYAYEALVGPIPDGMHLDHLCLTRRCVNPDHLEPVTNRENLLRSHRTFAGRQARVTGCPQGHAYAGANLYVDGVGGRHCVTCRAATSRGRRKAAA